MLVIFKFFAICFSWQFSEREIMFKISRLLILLVILMPLASCGINEQAGSIKLIENQKNIIQGIQKDSKIKSKKAENKLNKATKPQKKEKSLIKSMYKVTNYTFYETDYYVRLNKWKLVLVKGHHTQSELNRIAIKLHQDEPETCFELFSTLKTLKLQYLFRTKNINFSEKYYDRDWNGCINRLPEKWTYSSFGGTVELN